MGDPERDERLEGGARSFTRALDETETAESVPDTWFAPARSPSDQAPSLDQCGIKAKK
jgi:hypothetical protein